MTEADNITVGISYPLEIQANSGLGLRELLESERGLPVGDHAGRNLWKL